MAPILHELSIIAVELRSEKVTTRNKAAERLDTLLVNSKSELLALLAEEKEGAHNVSWTDLFNSAIEATIKHAVKMEHTQDAKSLQTMRNKNYLFNGLVTKIIDYNLESASNFLPLSTIFTAFGDGLSNSNIIKNFGVLFLNLLDRGLYKSDHYVRTLKHSEYSKTLTLLFELNVYNDEVLRSAVLRSIIRTIELSCRHVQIGANLIDYLPEVIVFVRKANDDRRKSDVLKLISLFVSQLILDYHQSICMELQELLPVVCDFYNFHMKPDTKAAFFQLMYNALNAIYPYVHRGDFTTLNITLKPNWVKCLRKLSSVVNVEVKERSLSLQRPGQQSSDKCLEQFVKMAAIVTYLIHWHVDSPATTNKVPDECVEPQRKMLRSSDKLEILLELVQPQESTFNEIWFAVVAELLCWNGSILNASNCTQVLQCTLRVYLQFVNINNLRNIRRCFCAILRFERHNAVADAAALGATVWTKLVEHLLAEPASNADMMEKQLLLQALIEHRKLNADNCTMLLQSFMANTTMRRTECINTMRHIFIHADHCGFEKTAPIVERTLNWCYEDPSKIDGKAVLLNISPLNAALIADTCAIAVINFLNDQQTFHTLPTASESQHGELRLQLLLYKYCKKFVCLDEHGKEMHSISGEQPNHPAVVVESKSNCLLQSQFELLMRLLNYETTKETNCSNIRVDLSTLQRITCLMKSLLQYNAFDGSNFTQCPLVKRIGFFLSHLELQLKNNHPRNIKYSDLLDILQRLEDIIATFTADAVLLEYLERQPLEELIEFLGSCLQFSAHQQNIEFDNWTSVTSMCVRILGVLCASSSHCSDAFDHVRRHKFKPKTDVNTVLKTIEIFSLQKAAVDGIAKWVVNNLTKILKLYHTKIETVEIVITLLPDIFNYVHQFEEPLQDMMLVVMSLLKICFKKSYSTQLAARLISSTRQIVRCCRECCGEENFTTICLSLAKFLSFPSLEIQFATINTLCALFDHNWLNISKSQVHTNFCEELYSHVDWKKLSTATEDMAQNSNAVTVQLLVSLFVFSSGHKGVALEELIHFCALRKLTEADLDDFQQIAQYLQCSLSELMRPYMVNLIHVWAYNTYPILKFPYFLCCSTRRKFITEHLPCIAVCLLLYYKSDELQKLSKYTSSEDILELALPVAEALMLVCKTKCREAETPEYRRHTKTLVENYNAFGINLLDSTDGATPNWQTIYGCLSALQDASHFSSTFGGLPIVCQPAKWFNISYPSLVACLRHYMVGGSAKGPLFDAILAKDPLTLVRIFGALKESCCICVFPEEKLHHISVFCLVAELVCESFPDGAAGKSASSSAAKFFLRDMLFYTVQYLQSVRVREIQVNLLKFLLRIVKAPRIAASYFHVIADNLSHISKTLVDVAESTRFPEVAALAANILTFIVLEHESQVEREIHLLNEFPASPPFAELRAYQQSQRTAARSGSSPRSEISTFLQMKNLAIEDLKATRSYIAQNKDMLQAANVPLSSLIMRLMQTIRSNPSANSESSLEAAKILGEIGSSKIQNVFYYFQSDVSFYENEAAVDGPEQYFVSCLLNTMDKILMNFNRSTYRTVHEVVGHLANSKQVKQSKDSFDYIKVFGVNAVGSCIDVYASITSIDWIAALQSAHAYDYNGWICAFVANIFETCGWKTFKQFAAMDSQFADAVLEPFVKLLTSTKDCHLQSVLQLLDFFFTQCYTTLNNTNNNSDSDSNGIFRDKRIIGKFLNISECIRIHNNWTLPINLLYVAKACNYCQAYFMSVMYLEMWALNEKAAASDRTHYEIMTNDDFQELAAKAYRSIGCCDAISGFLDPLQSRLDYLNLDNHWSDILIESDASEMISNELYASILKRNGMLSLAGSCQANKAIDYEVCWRLGQWGHTVEGHSRVNTLNDMENEFEKHHFNALKCLYNREENNAKAAVVNARQCVILILKEISFECLQSVYKYLTWLQFLQHIDDFGQIQFGTTTSVNEIFEKWTTESNMQYGSFHCKEQVLSHQITLFRTAGIRASRKIKEYYKENPIENCMLKCIKECRMAGQINLAKRNISLLKKMELSNEQIKINVLLEDAEVCLLTGKSQITKAILQHILKNKEYAYCLQRVSAFRMQGEYLMETNNESFETVLRTFFKASLDLLNKFEESKSVILQKYPNLFDLQTFELFKRDNVKAAYETIAKYADKEYTQLNVYATSEEFQMKCRIIRQNRQAAESIGKQVADRDKNIGAVFMKKFANLDEKEVHAVEEKRTDNLCAAIEHYMSFCRIDEAASSPAVYRIIALWFSNKQNEALHKKVEEHIATIPSYKFIGALNQMTARLNSKCAAFIRVLKDLLVRCAKEHPQQTLYQLYPLVFAFKDGDSDSAYNRVDIAKEIIAKAKNKLNASCIKQMEAMFPALIDFSNLNAADAKATSMTLSDKLKRLRNLDAVQCPTIPLNVSISLEYTYTSIIKWQDKVSLVGGINAPKKLTCLCSDGQTRPQLLKGKDDLRQDAVMQQVFAMINDLLHTAAEPTAGKLALRTYKVVPLSMRSGILEWCENTIPIGTYLISAHKKYRPTDYTCNKCRQLAMQHLKSSFEKRYQCYTQICENIKPVFHYFLFEKFLVPGVWFERRLAFTNSVATTSIVGYILGLGDRHTQNILIDENSAEVIHIDFGIAFEQGRIMPTPETVPFRLTRDMVAPMGVSETNGIFKKSCEATMHILRRNQSVITTILEVLLHDPLYIWKVVPQLDTAAADTHEKTNLTAQRALLCVQNKLEGKQNRILGVADVDVQVQRLINEAISSRNLCLLYPGWDPYL